MKDVLHRARQFRGIVVDAVRRAIDPPLDADARPIDVRRAIVEAVERQVVPGGAGRRVLPADRVDVEVLVTADERPALEAVLDDLHDAVAGRLRELHCDVPRRFTVDVRYLPEAPPAWDAGQRIAVRLARVSDDTAADDTAVPQPPIEITVVRGETADGPVVSTEPVIRIGRTQAPTDERGRTRHNHVAFLENDSPENRTVTRGHALIRFNAATGEYRLFDEGSANGTRVVRGGEVIDVPRRDPLGVALRSGDELQFGRAAVQVRIGPS